MPPARERPDLSRLQQVDLAHLLGRTARQIHNLTQLGMPTIEENGKRFYDGQACVAWFVAYKLKEIEESKEKTIDPQDRLNIAKAKLAEYELAEKEGQLVPIDYMRRQLEAIALRFKAALAALPSSLTPKLMAARSEADMQSRLAAGCRRASDDLSGLGEDPTLDAELELPPAKVA